jgi:hypothetical protein
MSRALTLSEHVNCESRDAVHELHQSVGQEQRTDVIGNEHRHARHFTEMSRQRNDKCLYLAMRCSHFCRLANSNNHFIFATLSEQLRSSESPENLAVQSCMLHPPRRFVVGGHLSSWLKLGSAPGKIQSGIAQGLSIHSSKDKRAAQGKQMYLQTDTVFR